MTQRAKQQYDAYAGHYYGIVLENDEQIHSTGYASDESAAIRLAQDWIEKNGQPCWDCHNLGYNWKLDKSSGSFQPTPCPTCQPMLHLEEKAKAAVAANIGEERADRHAKEEWVVKTYFLGPNPRIK